MLISKKQRFRHIGTVCNVALALHNGEVCLLCWDREKSHMKYSENMFPQGISFIQYQKENT